ncbi:hypothetical protein M2266_005464 [Streptomyces sp. SPB162]|nr:hypothetical protein [Streptomyces sp. SPB162]
MTSGGVPLLKRGCSLPLMSWVGSTLDLEPLCFVSYSLPSAVA